MSDILTQRAREMMDRYRVRVTRLYDFPDRLIGKLGHPCAIDHGKSGFLVFLGSPAIEKKTILLYDEAFKPVRKIVDVNGLFRMTYNPYTDGIIAVINASKMLANGYHEAMKHERNGVLEYDLKGKVSCRIMSAGISSFFPTAAEVLQGEEVILYDFATKMFRVVDYTGQERETFEVGNHFVRVMRAVEGWGIHFAVMSRRNYLGIETADNVENIYRIDEERNISLMCETSLPGKSEALSRQLYGMEIVGGQVLYSTDGWLIKVDPSGKEIFRLRMTDGVWGLRGREAYLTYLQRDRLMERTLYALGRSWNPTGEAMYHVFKIEV